MRENAVRSTTDAPDRGVDVSPSNNGGVTVLIGVPLALMSGWVALASLDTWRAVGIIAAITVGLVATAWRLRAPLTVYAVVWSACAAQAAISGLSLVFPSTLLFLVALYSVVAWAGEPARITAISGAFLGAFLGAWVLITDDSVRAAGLRPEPVMVVAVLSAVVLATIGIGHWRRDQSRQLASAAQRARQAERDRTARLDDAVRLERRRMARDMHDVVAHSLAVVISQARGGRYAAVANPDRAIDVLKTIEDEGRQALRDMRGMVRMLRVGGEESATTIGEEPQPGLADIPGLVERAGSTGRIVAVETVGRPQPLSGFVELTVYRFVQESLTNVVRHAAPGSGATLTIRWATTELTIEVVNEAAATARVHGEGFGLIGMAERVRGVGGSMATHDDGGRFRVVATIPLTIQDESAVRLSR
ncbi:sensor histidine kinase [Stackebrandtia soli]|uniref:sensor histidine kinase n=1 Tax=Stackebrandtia soli TaxID=1892856 RepID=UPI0039EA15D1